MAGEIQLNSTTMATESSGSITAQLDTIRPNTTNGSLTLQGDSSDSGVTGLTIDSSGNATFAGTANNIGTVTAGTFNGTIGDSITLSQGTWTPTFTDSVGTDLVTTYGDRVATYTRIGNIVFFNCDINTSSYTNSSTSQLYLSGLPTFGVSFSASNVEDNGFAGGIVSYYSGTQSFASSYSIHWVLQNTGRINFYYAGGVNTVPFQQNYLTSSSRFIVLGRYYLASIT